MANVFEVLKADHEEVEQMLQTLESATMDEKLESVAQRLVIEASKHEAVEEAHFWPVVRERVSDSENLVKSALEQEDEGKKVLDQLRKAHPGDEDFERLVQTFAIAGRDHIAYEEGQVWPKLREVLSDADSEQLGSTIADAKSSAPTRPHPNVPSDPNVQKAAGPAAGLADKARDALTDRG